MTVAESGRQERRKARTRAQILDAAEQLFSATGDATIEQISATADVAVATVYAHFSGKAEIHREVVERALADNERYMLAVYTTGNSPIDMLVDAAGAYVAFFRESPQRFRLIALRLNGPGGEASAADEMLAARVDRMTGALADTVAQATADGSLRKVDPLDTARFLWGAGNGVIALAMRPDSLRLTGAQLEAALETGLVALIEGLVTDARRGPDGRIDEALRTRISVAVRGGDAATGGTPDD